MNDLKIKQEFKDLIPPLSEHERAGLEEDIKHFGCYCPIITWKGYIIDGHHRYEICMRNKLSFHVEEREFDDENDAEIWIIHNQFRRRNLQPYTRATLTFELEKRLKTRRGENQYTKESGSRPYGREADRNRDHEARTKAAKAAGMGHNTYAKCKYISQNGSKEQKKDLHHGKTTPNEIYGDIKRGKAKAEVIERLESIEAKEAKAIEGVYDVVVIDPPWPMQKIERDVSPQEVGFDYPTMTLEDIGNMKVPCAEDCHIFLWTTQKFLRPSFKILEDWGLTYVCLFTWMKNGGFQPFNLPQFNTEFILYAHKGNPKFVDLKQFMCGFQAARGKHSEKPGEFYEVLNRTTAGRRLDMFNRRRIEGFEGWGNESVI